LPVATKLGTGVGVGTGVAVGVGVAEGDGVEVGGITVEAREDCPVGLEPEVDEHAATATRTTTKAHVETTRPFLPRSVIECPPAFCDLKRKYRLREAPPFPENRFGLLPDN
jgi:hypothetical protein